MTLDVDERAMAGGAPRLTLRGSAGEAVVLALGALAPDDPTGVALHLRVACWGFAAACETWVDRAAWARFVDELAAVERDRRGGAALSSTSPGELALAIRVVDRAGHVAVAGRVGVRGARTAELAFDAIELAPDALPEAVRQARALDAAVIAALGPLA